MYATIIIRSQSLSSEMWIPLQCNNQQSGTIHLRFALRKFACRIKVLHTWTALDQAKELAAAAEEIPNRHWYVEHVFDVESKR
jgi:hypothetical protein